MYEVDSCLGIDESKEIGLLMAIDGYIVKSDLIKY